MPATPSEIFTVGAAEAGCTLAALLRSHCANHSWTQVRRLIAARRVKIGGEVCLDPARRLRPEEVVELLAQPTRPVVQTPPITVRFLDEHLVVVEKPSGLSTVRHPTERYLSARRRALSPTLEDIVSVIVAANENQRKGTRRRLRIVHRLDKGTSGLVVFARTVVAERGLGRQFREHTVMRRYLAIVRGNLPAQRIVTHLVRDRGDGRRGSTNVRALGKKAITHVEVIERLGHYTLLSCRLETGRTHQIRIHLAELGHPVCGETVYNRPFGLPPLDDPSEAPRLALHAAELGFVHPVSAAVLHWTMRLPTDLETFVEGLRRQAHGPAPD